MANIGEAVVQPGDTVGLFSVAGATVGSAEIRISTSNNSPFKFVGTSAGDGPSMWFNAKDSYITNEELYVKNVSDVPASLTVMVIGR